MSFLLGLLNVIFIVLTLLLAVVDFIMMRLPDKLTFPLLGVALIHAALLGSQVLLQNGITALIIGGLFALIALIYPRGMGWGDVKYVTGLALFLGFPAEPLALLMATFMALLLGGILILLKRMDLRQQISFGPFLTLGAWISLFVL